MNHFYGASMRGLLTWNIWQKESGSVDRLRLLMDTNIFTKNNILIVYNISQTHVSSEYRNSLS